MRPRVRLVLGQPPLRPSQERLSFAYLATAWTLGRDAASRLPIDALVGPAVRAPWGWQATALRRSLEAVEPLLARDGRVVLLLEGGGPEALASAALGGAAAGFRVVAARLGEPDDDSGGLVELVPPGASVPGASVPGTALHGGTSSDEALRPDGAHRAPDGGPRLFPPPERVDTRPFSAAEAAKTVTETTVEILRARGEPARTERLIGEVVVGLDRAGHLRRLAVGTDGAGGYGEARTEDRETVAENAVRVGTPTDNDDARGLVETGAARPSPGAVQPDRDARPATTATPNRSRPRPSQAADVVERLMTLVRDELGRAAHPRLREIEPERWWLADRRDADQAAAPLSDRVEWAVYSLLSTAGPIAEDAFFERIAALFTGRDLPDEALVRACLQSYRSLASTPDGLVTSEDVLRRSGEHAELLAMLAEGGHRAGLHVWLGRLEQVRRIGSRQLGELLDDRERDVYLPLIVRAPAEEVQAVDCIWYVRGRAAIIWELEWTAMLGEPILRRGARIPQEDNLVRFLAFAPERTELVRHKLERSPVLRASIDEGNWHLLKWNHLRAWLSSPRPDLVALEPLLGLDPIVERSGDQLLLFEG
jgi:hypothetical protein